MPPTDLAAGTTKSKTKHWSRRGHVFIFLKKKKSLPINHLLGKISKPVFFGKKKQYFHVKLTTRGNHMNIIDIDTVKKS
jgi:hypothetical protein